MSRLRRNSDRPNRISYIRCSLRSVNWGIELGGLDHAGEHCGEVPSGNPAVKARKASGRVAPQQPRVARTLCHCCGDARGDRSSRKCLRVSAVHSCPCSDRCFAGFQHLLDRLDRVGSGCFSVAPTAEQHRRYLRRPIRTALVTDVALTGSRPLVQQMDQSQGRGGHAARGIR